MPIKLRSYVKSWSACVLCMLGLVGFLPTTAQSAIVTFNFSGFVTSVDEYLIDTGISVGDLVTGNGAYDIAAPDQNSDPTLFIASFPSGSAYLTVNMHASAGVLSFSVGPGTNGQPISLWNYDQSYYSPGDYFEFGGNNTNGINMPAFTTGLYNQVDLNFFDEIVPFDMLDGITPPTDALPDLTKVTSQASFVRGFAYSGPEYYNVQFMIESAAVPEPGTLSLLSIVGVCLGGYGWRKRRQVL